MDWGQKILVLSGPGKEHIDFKRSREGSGGTDGAPKDKQGILDPPKALESKKSPNTKANCKTPRAKEHSYAPGAQVRWRILFER